MPFVTSRGDGRQYHRRTVISPELAGEGREPRTEDCSQAVRSQSGAVRSPRRGGVTARSWENMFALACAVSVGSYTSFPLSGRLWSRDRPLRTSHLSNGLLQLRTLSVWRSEGRGSSHSRTVYSLALPLYDLTVGFWGFQCCFTICPGKTQFRGAPSTIDEMR